MVQRITYRRRLSYNTKSNRVKKVRTPGGKLVFQYSKKRPTVPKCPMTGVRLKGIKPSRPAERKRLSLRHKKVFRAYGGKSASPKGAFSRVVMQPLPCSRCLEPQSCPWKDRPCFLDRRAEAGQLAHARRTGHQGWQGINMFINHTTSRKIKCRALCVDVKNSTSLYSWMKVSQLC